jgi:uncharacterized Zn finger protein
MLFNFSMAEMDGKMSYKEPYGYRIERKPLHRCKRCGSGSMVPLNQGDRLMRCANCRNIDYPDTVMVKVYVSESEN